MENNNIFDNLKKKYIESLSPEEIEAYKRFGEKFYAVDFTEQNLNSQNHKVINLEESLANIVRGLNSGLHPMYIDENEEHLLKSAYGNEWYKKWGYKSKSDL